MGKNAIDSSVVVKNIESKLKELKLSKAEFYRESGITSATLSNWRSETYAPSQEKLAAAAEVLGVSAIWLLTEHNSISVETEKDPATGGEVSEDDLKFALFGGEATDKQLDEVRRFARFIKERDAK